MASHFGSPLSSELVVVIADHGSATFTVHKDILVGQSILFEFSVPGTSDGRLIELPGWDSETVARVLEFLYRGKYTYPDPIHRPPDSTPLVTLSLGGEDGCSPSPGGGFGGAANEHVETAVERLARFDPTLYDYRGVFLAHAHVYNLAQIASIVRLRPLALKHLSDTLSCFSEPVLASTPFLGENVLALARYVYNSSPGEHRTLVSQFIARNFAALNTTASLSRLLAECGPLVKDVMMSIHTCPVTPAPADSLATAPSRYIAKMLVMPKGPEHEAPHDHLRDLSGGKATINHANSTEHDRWLIPSYTAVADDACTGISVLIDKNPITRTGAVRFAADRFVVSTVDRAVKIKITNVALLRHSKHLAEVSAVPREYGCWDGMSTDLNTGRRGGYLYVLWQSVNVG